MFGFAVALIALSTTVAAASSVLKPPVIRESFSPLACPRNPQTTLAAEGCAERQILATDRVINRKVALIFRLLPTYARRVKFVQGERSYLRHRHAQCLKEAAVVSGGTAADVDYALCVVANNRGHIKALAALRSVLPRR